MATLCELLGRQLGPLQGRVGVITPYKAQKSEVQGLLRRMPPSLGAAGVDVDVVDGFQGREMDIIIMV